MDDLQLRPGQHQTKTILHETIICYCSVFDLNAEVWINTSENITRLFTQVHQSLGKSVRLRNASLWRVGERWHLWFAEIVSECPAAKGFHCDVTACALTYALNLSFGDKEQSSMQFQMLFRIYLLHCFEDSCDNLDTFYAEALKYLTAVGRYAITNQSDARQLIESFFRVAQSH